MIQRWGDYWHGMLATLEGLNGKPVSIFKGAEWERVRRHKLDATQILRGLAVLFIAVWVVMLEYWWYNFVQAL